MQTGQILLVDDDPALLQALPHTIALRLTGVEIATADSAQTALELLQKQEYDAIVSDIKMPGIDGLALMAQVYERYPETPVLLITGHGEHNLAIQALRGGAYDYIQKPIDRDDFVMALQRALHTRQLRRQIQEQQRALEQYAFSLERLVEQRTRELAVANEAQDSFLILCRSRCDLAAVCRQTLDEDRAATGIAAACEILADHLEAEVDRAKISQALSHLLSNAHLYSSHGVPIIVTLRRAGEEATISVRDQGRGIPAEYLPHIFQPFYHVPDMERDSSSGLGLGLYIAKAIVERHGGRIEVQSNPGQGSTFSIVLPLL